MAIKVVLLIGSGNSGKNTTLIQFCKFYGYKPKINKKGKEVFRRGKVILKGKINNKEVLILPLTSSPQEKTDFCNVEKVKEIISKFMKNNKKTAKKEDYNEVLVIIAFTIRTYEGNIGEKCITEPIDILISEGYEIFKVYLKREDIPDFERIDNFVENKLKYDKLIISKKDEGIRQATELKEFVEDKVYGFSTKS